MKQRDNLWRQMRLGDVTASRFHDVLTRSTAGHPYSVEGKRGEWHVARSSDVVSGHFSRQADAKERMGEMVAEWQETRWSQTAETYLSDKVSELLDCKPADVWRSDATDWGTANEPLAFKASIPVIEERFGETLLLPVDEFAYVQHPTEPHIGCSPDGIIGTDGLCEIKCPYNGGKWVTAKRAAERDEWTVPNENIAQVQGSLWVTGRKWYAFCYFDPRKAASEIDPLLVIKVERDDDYIDNVLAPRVIAFRDYLRAEYKKLIGEKEPF